MAALIMVVKNRNAVASLSPDSLIFILFFSQEGMVPAGIQALIHCRMILLVAEHPSAWWQQQGAGESSMPEVGMASPCPVLTLSFYLSPGQHVHSLLPTGIAFRHNKCHRVAGRMSAADLISILTVWRF